MNTTIRDFLIKKCGLQKKKGKNSKKNNKQYSNRYYKLRARKRKLRYVFRKAKRDKADKKTLSKLNHLKRSVSRSLKRLRAREQENIDAKILLNSQKSFNENPHLFAKRTFSKQSSGSPQFDEKTCEILFKKTYNDEYRDTTYTPIPDFTPHSPLKFHFNNIPIS